MVPVPRYFFYKKIRYFRFFVITYRLKIKPSLFGVEVINFYSEMYRYGLLQRKVQDVLANNEYVIAASLLPQFRIIYDDEEENDGTLLCIKECSKRSQPK